MLRGALFLGLCGSISAAASPSDSATAVPDLGAGATYPVGVALGTFVGGFTSGPIQVADVYYPKSATPGQTFPLISFAHGIFSGATATSLLYSNLLTQLAAAGYLVVAIDVCGTVCDLDAFAADQRHVIDVVRAGASSSPLWALANTSTVGLAGHSYGADASLVSGKVRRADVGAIWSMHPCPAPELGGKIDVGRAAIAVNTGTLDTVCNPYGVLDYYNHLVAPSRFYFSLDFATHLEIENGYPERFNAYVPRFFDCHLRGDTDACGRMYGGSGHSGVCKDLPMYECHKA